MMQRRHGGKRIRMDEPPPDIQEHLAEMADDIDEHMEGPSSGGVRPARMTRLRARGGVPLKAPIIDDDDDDIFFGGGAAVTIPPLPKRIKQKREPRAPKQPRPPKLPKEPRVRREHDEKEQTTDREREITTDENSLFYIIRHSKSSISSIVDDWIDNYKADRDSALIVLMQFFINASGCKGKITPEMQTALEHTAIIRKMTEEFDEESGEYPLIMPGQQWKKFKTNFCDFVQNLVRKCQNEIIYDQFLMDNVISLLTGLSDSQVRAFRHTATLAAMKLMTALVDVALMVSVHFDNTQRQYEAERAKSRTERASDRLESLMQRRSELEENMDEIKNMLTYMFKSVFVHRYRDTLPDIRAICMSEIGIWMQKFSQSFLDDSYLKYIGWTLHDKVGEVRLRCLQALLPLYENELLKGKLELFTSKFKDRIVAMALDKEFEVAVHAVKLVLNILKTHQDILTDKDCEIVYELVYSSHRGVAQAAAEFLNYRLFTPDPEAVQGIKTRRGKQRLVNTPLIRDLVQFFIESELHEHGAYLVDSFLENNPMIKDWECMTDLLLEDPGPDEEPLDDKQESSLIEIMVSAIRQCATGEPPVGRGSSRKMALSTKDIKQVQDDKQKLTEHFIQGLPSLVDKYIADTDKLTNLIAIPQYFDLEIYTTTRQTSKLQELLDKISHTMQRHYSIEVLETCARTLGYLCAESTGISTICDVARSNLIDACVNKYKESIDDWRNLIEGEEIPDEEEKYNVVISLKRVSILFAAHDLNAWNLFPSIFQDIEDSQGNFSPDRQFPEDGLCHCIKGCFYSINWALYYIENLCDTSSAPGFVSQLHEMLFKYVEICNRLLTSDTTGVSVKEEAYISICDLLVVFSEQLSVNTNENIRNLVFKPDEHQYGILNTFVQEHVFGVQQEEGHDETKIEELHKKRNFLASYCKLVIYNIIPTLAATDIFKHYLRFYNDYGDIIKTTLGKAREINKINCALTMCLTLVNGFNDIRASNGSSRISKNSQELQDLKELAKRFALSFGLDQIKNREAIASLHRAGILFAVSYPQEQYEDPSSPPPHILFLEILNEFTNKLLKQDKKVILSFLDSRTGGGIPSSRSEDWQPLIQYRSALVHGDESNAPSSAKKNYSKRKRDDQTDDEEDHDQEMHPIDPQQ